MLLDRPVKLDDETFARTIAEAEVPVLADFYADWGGPCKIMAPYVDELAREHQGKALIARLDTDRAQQTAGGFNIRGVRRRSCSKAAKKPRVRPGPCQNPCSRSAC